MRNAVSYFKQYRPAPLKSTQTPPLAAGTLARAARGTALTLLVLALAGLAWAQAQPLPLPGTPAPAHARLFTPRAVPPGSFVVCTIDEPIGRARDIVKAALAPGLDAAAADRTWRVTRQHPLHAFGHVAPYDKARLAQLYVDRRVEVLRAPIERDGRVIASVTLISPYPDASLSRLEPGTLAILFDVAAARSGAPSR